MAKFIDISSQKFGEWTVKEYVGKGKWKCVCSCGTVENVLSTSLRNGKSTKCRKHPKIEINSICNHWKILRYAGDGTYECECINCGKTYIIRSEYLGTYALRKCECMGNRDKRDELEGRTFGYLKVMEYVGYKTYRCKCLNCGNETKTYLRSHLINGEVKSCGCMTVELFKNTIAQKYGETNIPKIRSPRQQWQIEAVSNKDNLESYLISLTESGNKLYINDLCNKLGLNKTNMYKKLHEFGLVDYIEKLYSTSYMEEDLARYIESLGCKIERHSKNIIGNYEFDIYIPDKKIAIEFNGTYWHSDVYKDAKYHQNKSIMAIKKGIQLIHIFEYEWDMHNKLIKEYLKHRIVGGSKKYYARKTSILEIDNDTAYTFCEKYHLNGYAASSIRLGCYYNDELIGVMTFGKPRFNTNYEYEVIRLCWKSGVDVVGGSNKLFNAFLQMTNAKRVLTYVNFSKFTGESYLKLGFNYIKEDIITYPNYIWTDGYGVLSRYMTQRSKLDDGGNSELTENDIMRNEGYIKVYDCGNLKMQYIKED